MNQQRDYMLGAVYRDFKEDEFSGERHSLKAPKQFSPQLACQEFHRGANSGSTWGWLPLGGVKKLDRIFGLGQMPAIISHISSLIFSCHKHDISAETFSEPNYLPNCSPNYSLWVHLSLQTLYILFFKTKTNLF